MTMGREVSLEARGTKTNSFNALFGAWLGAYPSLKRSHHKPAFAGRSKAKVYCFALEGSSLDCSYA